MDNNTIFEEFWKNFNWPTEQPIFYRLYYNDSGEPLCYTMEDLPGKYVEITADQFRDSNPHVRVRNGKLIKLEHYTTRKLTPSTGGTCCHPDNIAVVVPESESNIKWKIKNHDNS